MSTEYDSYLVLIPRGLHMVARDIILQELSSFYVDVQFLGEEGKDEASYVSHLADLIARNEMQGSTKRVSFVKSSCYLPVGSVAENKQHLSLGYLRKRDPVWSKAGELMGSVWVKILTDAPPEKIGKDLRVVGPILALVKEWESVELSSSQSLAEVISSLRQFAVNVSDSSVQSALKLWCKHAKTCWDLSDEEMNEISELETGSKATKFRLSCLRSESEKYQYSRQQLLAESASVLVPMFVRKEMWKADLTNYHLELVVLMHPHSLALGIALRPYQRLGAKSFALGKLPPDISAPYLSGQAFSGLVRLRPTTAQLLIHLADIQRGDVVVDTVAGVGTIPIEASFGKNGTVGFGGDIALTPQGLASVASRYTKQAREYVSQQCSKGGVADLMAWDATNLPFRDASVDVCIGDLPFGKMCMSAAKLDEVMPLMISEIARILRPNTGRMVLLCGNFYHVLNALQQLNSSQNEASTNETANTIELPCDSICPVNIGGMVAWVVIAKRGAGKARPIKNQKERVRKLAHKRERNDKLRVFGKAGKKRLQSGM